MKTTNNERLKLHEALNKLIDIPYVPEPVESLIFDKALDILEQVISENLPEYASDFFRDTKKGFNSGDVQPLKDSIKEFINGRVNIPILNKGTENKIFNTLIDVLFSALEVEKNIDNIATN